jgi:hypothetical protein
MYINEDFSVLGTRGNISTNVLRCAFALGDLVLVL